MLLVTKRHHDGRINRFEFDGSKVEYLRYELADAQREQEDVIPAWDLTTPNDLLVRHTGMRATEAEVDTIVKKISWEEWLDEHGVLWMQEMLAGHEVYSSCVTAQWLGIKEYTALAVLDPKAFNEEMALEAWLKRDLSGLEIESIICIDSVLFNVDAAETIENFMGEVAENMDVKALCEDITKVYAVPLANGDLRIDAHIDDTDQSCVILKAQWMKKGM